MILTSLIVVKVNGVHDADDECDYEDDTVHTYITYMQYTIHTLYWTRILFWLSLFKNNPVQYLLVYFLPYKIYNSF